MKRWQYMLLDISERKSGGTAFFKLLDRYGRDGWELVSALKVESSHRDYFINRLWFKRPAKKSPPKRSTTK